MGVVFCSAMTLACREDRLSLEGEDMTFTQRGLRASNTTMPSSSAMTTLYNAYGKGRHSSTIAYGKGFHDNIK